MKQKFIEIYNLIERSERVLLATHESPDGDGISSMLALHNWLETTRPQSSFLYSKDKIPAYLNFLPGAEKILNKIPNVIFDLLIGLDYGDFRRLGLDEWLKTQQQIKIITFDHHSAGKPFDTAQGRKFDTINIIDSTSSSTAELIYDFFEANDIKLEKEIAKCILCGIMLDTGDFKHSNTTPKTLRTVKKLLLKGVTTKEIVNNMEKNLRPISAMKLWGETLLKIKISPKNGLAISFANKVDYLKNCASKEYLSDFSSVMEAVPEAKLAVFLSQDLEEPQFIKGSLRSENYKNVDVSKVAQHFGGGGHKLASGFRIESTMEDAMEKLINIGKIV